MGEGCQFVHAAGVEALVEEADTDGVADWVDRGAHDRVGEFHVREGVEHGDLAAERLVVHGA